MEVLVLIATLGVIGGMAVWALIGTRPKAERVLRAQRRRTVNEVRNGELVKLVGTVRPCGHCLVAPLTGRSAVAYDVLLVSVSTREAALPVVMETKGVDFDLDDETGKAHVQLGPIQVFAR